MNGIIFLFIRVIASPLVNVFQKNLTNRGVEPVFIVLVSYVFFSLLAIPYVLISGAIHYNLEFWIYIFILSIIDSFGNIFLVRSLKSIDFSIFGPLNSFKPVVALFLSVFILQEIPSWAGVLGVIIIIAGSYILYLSDKNNAASFWSFLNSRGIGYRFLSIVLTSIAAVLSKKVIPISSPLVVLCYWSLIGLPVVAIYFISRRTSIRQELNLGKEVNIKNYIGLLIAFLFMQIFSLYTFKYVYIGYSLALFQLSSVFSVFLGSKVFKEKDIKFRYLASLIMILGSIIIFLGG